MAGLGLNIVIDRMSQPGSPFSERLDRLGIAVAAALEDLEEMVRAEAVAAGVPQAHLEEHVGTAVGVVVGNRCRGTVIGAAKRRSPGDTP